MSFSKHTKQGGGFTLMETVIAIAVLAVLLTAFLSVFGPAAQQIQKAISVEEANRLAATLEAELVTLRSGDQSTYSTGFEKAYEWISDSSEGGEPLIIYQYRGDPSSIRADGTPEPHEGEWQGGSDGFDLGVGGTDFIVQPIVRKQSDPELEEDFDALEGKAYTVKLTQLVYEGGQWVPGTPGEIVDPVQDDQNTGGGGTDADTYPEAVIAFEAEFFVVPNSSYRYVSENLDLANLRDPVFTRNLAVRR